MYEHRRTASWSDTPTRFADVTASQRAKPGRSGRNVFSQFLSPSVPKQPMHILPKTLPSTLYDDPAFSLDPHAHPFFATPSAPWATPHPPPPLFQDTDEFQLLQPPNTPMFSDDHSSTTHETNSSSNHTSTTSTSLSSPPTSTDSHSSPWALQPSEKAAQPLPWPPETQKKKMNIAMFWRRTPPETVLQSVDLGRTAPPEPSPSRETVSPHRPAPARNVTAPETIQTATRPILPPRPVTTAADSKPPPAASRRIIGGRVLRAHELDRIDELDESNPLGLPLHHRGPYEAVQESNEEDVTHNIGSQYQITSSPPIPKSKQDRNKPHARNLPQMTSVPIIPAGVSLNLSPGQILPRNFYHQLNQNHVSPGLFDAPGWPPRPRPQPDIQQSTYPAGGGYQQQMENQNPPFASRKSNTSNLEGGQGFNRLRSDPPEYSAVPMDASTTKRDRRSAPSQTSSSSSYSPQEVSSAYDPLMGADDVRRYHRPSAIDFQQHAGIFVNNIQPPPDRGPATGHRQSQSNPRLPPRMQALQMQNGRPDEIHRRSPRPYNGTQEVGGSLMDNIPVQTSHRRRSQVLGQAPYTPQIEPDQLPLFIDNNGFPAPGPISPPFESPQAGLDQMHRSAVSQQPQPPEPDSRSSHRSMTDSSRSTNSGNSRTLPPPNHIPKRLVMPAPLQSSQPVAPRHQPSHLQPPRHVDGPSWQPQLRPPSPLMVPTVLGPHIDGQLLRVQEVPMSQSRKLRKRISVQGLPAPLVAPSQPLSFEPKTFYTDILPPQAVPAARKLEKTPKKVLSKRRTDF